MTASIGRTILLAGMLCLGAAALLAQQYPPPFPREAARLVFENDRVAVWDVTWPLGQPTAMHEHAVDQLSVTLVGGTKRVTSLGGAPRTGKSERGQIVFTPKGTIHMEEGVSEVPERKIMLQLKTSTPATDTLAGTTPAAFPRQGAVKLLENDRVIVWDYTWQRGEKTPLHAHYRDSVLVFLEGVVIRAAAGNGSYKDTARKRDEVMFGARNQNAQTDEAIEGSPRAITVELK